MELWWKRGRERELESEREPELEREPEPEPEPEFESELEPKLEHIMTESLDEQLDLLEMELIREIEHEQKYASRRIDKLRLLKTKVERMRVNLVISKKDEK